MTRPLHRLATPTGGRGRTRPGRRRRRLRPSCQQRAIRDNGNRAQVRWTFRTRDIIEVSTSVAADGTVIVGTNNDVQYGLRPGGTVRWRFDRGDWTFSSPVVRDGRAWFGDHLGRVDILDTATGRLVRNDLGLPKAQGTTSAGTGVWTAPLVDRDQNVFWDRRRPASTRPSTGLSRRCSRRAGPGANGGRLARRD